MLVRSVVVLIFVLLETSCHSLKTPELPQQDVPKQWRYSLGENVSSDNFKVDWWTAFKQPQLNQLVESAISQNLTVEQIRLRIAQVRAMTHHHYDDAFLPQLAAHARPVESIDTRDSYFQYGIDALWDLGLFGRKQAQHRVMIAQWYRVNAEYQDAYNVATAEVARLFIELNTLQKNLSLVSTINSLDKQRVASLEKLVSLHMYNRDKLDDAQRSYLQSSKAHRELQQRINETAQQLAILLGREEPLSEWNLFAEIPQTKFESLLPVPRELIRRRPEIQMAEAAVIQAAGEAGIAKSEIYPHVSLGSAYFYSTNITKNYDLDNVQHSSPSVGPIIDIPLFDWGQRRVAAQAKKIALKESLLAYRESVLQVIGQVNLAIDNYNKASENLRETQAVFEHEIRQWRNAETIYERRLIGELELLTLNKEHLQSQIDLNDVIENQSLAFVLLNKTLAGSPLQLEVE